jgi:hypothetical protein
MDSIKGAQELSRRFDETHPDRPSRPTPPAAAGSAPIYHWLGQDPHDDAISRKRPDFSWLRRAAKRWARPTR